LFSLSSALSLAYPGAPNLKLPLLVIEFGQSLSTVPPTEELCGVRRFELMYDLLDSLLITVNSSTTQPEEVVLVAEALRTLTQVPEALSNEVRLLRA
jgi:hypothetical protein